MRRTAAGWAGRHAGSSSMHEAALENRGAKCPGRRVGRGAGSGRRARGTTASALRQAGRVGAGTAGRAAIRAAALATRSPRRPCAWRRRAAVRAALAGSVPARGRRERWGWWWRDDRGDMAATEGADSRRAGPPQWAPGTPGAGNFSRLHLPARGRGRNGVLSRRSATTGHRARPLSGWAPRRSLRPCITLVLEPGCRGNCPLDTGPCHGQPADARVNSPINQALTA